LDDMLTATGQIEAGQAGIGFSLSLLVKSRCRSSDNQ
jgi:hypothetical protein